VPSLREVQRAFSDAVLSDDSQGMAGLVLENGMVTEDRMRIYRNNARIGFHAALRAAFPVIERLGGDEWFESVALRYQRRFPSQHGDLQYVGSDFPGFLVEDLTGTTYAWFADVARLEWSYQEVLVAADSPVIDVTALAALSPDEQGRLTFMPRAALRLVQSTVPVLDIWKVNQPGVEVQDVSLDAGPSRVLLLRRADHVEMRELPQGVFELLSAFAGGLTLQAATESVQAMLPDFELGAALRHLVELDTLCGFRIHPVI
jgi:Putative DNA-binding domain